MQAISFFRRIGYDGQEASLSEAFRVMFARSLDKNTLTDGQRLAVMSRAFLTLKRERDAALAALRREIQVSDGLRQASFVFRQERLESETPQPL